MRGGIDEKSEEQEGHLQGDNCSKLHFTAILDLLSLYNTRYSSLCCDNFPAISTHKDTLFSAIAR